MTTKTFARPDWATSPLYNVLITIFPEHITPYNVLDIRRLRTDLGKSHEAIYKWLRAGRVPSAAARKLCDIANGEDNIAALRKLGRTPPKIGDFDAFVYA